MGDGAGVQIVRAWGENMLIKQASLTLSHHTFQRAHKVSPEPGLGGEGNVLGVAVEIHRVVGREQSES